MTRLRTAARRAEAPAVRRDATRSAEAKSMVADLMELPPYIRRDILASLSARDLTVLLAATDGATGSPYGLYVDDAFGFITGVLGESVWSKPRQIMESVTEHTRTAVPSCFSSGKTHTASRLAIWHSMVYPPGTALTVTIAPLWRQVIRQVWREIRAAHKRSGLPGHADMAQLKVPDRSGLEHVVAYGLAAPPHAEHAVQGIHAPKVLLLVDEAGGIGHIIGNNLRAMLTGDDTRMVAIGNPATDDEGSWFEELCGSDRVNTIRIGTLDTPAFTGEDVDRCFSCPLEVPEHPVSKHLVQPGWYEETLEEYGEDAPYVIAKVHANFPTGGSLRVIPTSWVIGAVEVEEPEDDEAVRLDQLGLPEERATWKVMPGAWVRLGVDVAADGGDELVIARAVGDLITVEHTSQGETNANAINVAGKILLEIRRAEALATRLGSTAQVRVKIDSIGVGWGVASALAAWAVEGVHGAEIVPVNVAESTDRQPDGAAMVPFRKRDELWISGRQLVHPSSATGEPTVRLRVDKKTRAQLSAPTYATTSGGHTKVESKKSLKARGLNSPDRAEAVLLAVYEPAPPKPKRKKARLLTLGGESA